MESAGSPFSSGSSGDPAGLRGSGRMSGDNDQKSQGKVRGPEWLLQEKNKISTTEVTEQDVRTYMPDGPQKVSVSNLTFVASDYLSVLTYLSQ